MKVKKSSIKIKSVKKYREKAILELRFGLNGGKPKHKMRLRKYDGFHVPMFQELKPRQFVKLNKGISRMRSLANSFGRCIYQGFLLFIGLSPIGEWGVLLHTLYIQLLSYSSLPYIIYLIS